MLNSLTIYEIILLAGVTATGIHSYLKTKEKSIFIDMYIPCCLLLIPIFIFIFTYINDAPLFIFTYMNNSSLFKFVYLFLIHIFIIALLIYLNRIREWDDKFYGENKVIKNVFSPIFLLHLSFALAYIYAFIILIFTIRYLNIGTARDLTTIYFYMTHTQSLPFYILFLCYFPLIYWFILLFTHIKYLFWMQTANFCSSLHLILIQEKRYFLVCQSLYKKLNKIRLKIIVQPFYNEKVFNFFYNYTSLIFLFLLFCYEAYFYYSIFYFYYALFIFLLIKPFSTFLTELHNSNWVYDVCRSDYLYKQYFNTYYTQAMYGRYFRTDTSPDTWFGFTWDLTEEEKAKISILRKKFQKSEKKPPRSYLAYHKYYEKVWLRVKDNNNLLAQNIFVRVNYGLTNRFQRRFTHTSTSEPIIRATSVIIGKSANWAERGALLNNSWSHYNIITKNHNINFPMPNELYQSPILEYKRNNHFYMQHFIEENTLTNFLSLSKFGIYPNTFPKTVIKSHQKKPDVYFNSHFNNEFNIQSFSMDLKSGTQKNWSNIITPGKSKEEYVEIFYESNILNKRRETAAIRSQKDKLISSLEEDYEIYLIQWIKFGVLINDPYCMPALRVFKNFSTINLTPNATEIYYNAHTKLYTLNALLKTKNLDKKTILKYISGGKNAKILLNLKI
jgi:hypothetical protein